MLSRKKAFQRKVTVALIMATTALTLAVSTVIYARAFHEQMEGIRRTITCVASTGALTIDGELHQTIPADSSAADTPAYQQLQRQLRQILGANPGVRYAWTMVPSEKSGELIFVGDVGGGRPKPGLRYQASHIPDLLAGFKGPSSDRYPVKDPWGISVSGYAPIRNKAGHVVGILGVDIYGRQLYLFRQRFKVFLAVCLVIGILFAVLMGYLVARWIAHPLNQLIQGMRRVARGDLSHRVAVTSADEFQEAAITFNRMTTNLREAREELRGAFLKSVQSLMSALEAKDPYTRGHSESVAQYATRIAQVLGRSKQEIETLQKLASLHDIGKIGIHDEILFKPGSFTEHERKSMEDHPMIGGKILAPLGLSPEELSLIVDHHEREDGSGYPRCLNRSQISDLVAIVSVADAYDAMTSHRPHRLAMKPEEALKELRSVAGTKFRKEIVEALGTALHP